MLRAKKRGAPFVLNFPRMARIVTPGLNVTVEFERSHSVLAVTQGEPSNLGGTMMEGQQLSSAACSASLHSASLHAAV